MSIKSSLGRQLGTQFDTVFDVVKSNPIYDKAGGSIPSLDLNFAKSKSLIDSRSTKNKITFTRASSSSSSATYVGSDGLIKTATTNLWQWSNSATNGETWNNVGVHLDITSGQVDPAGGTTAIRASDANNNTGGTSLQRTNLASLTTGATVSYSIWLKPISCPNDLLTLIVYANGTTDYISAPFPVSGGQITGMGIANASGTGVAINSSVTPYPNGWYRCVLTGIPSTVTMTDVRARVVLGSYQRVQGTARFDWYGAQLEQSSTVGEYIPTTGTTNSAPRFDHDPTTGESLGLLVEESRTNLIVNSEDFTNSYWLTNNVNGTLTPDQAVAPDGTITAGLYTEDTATSGRYFAKLVSCTSGTFYTISIWAKQASGTRYLGLVLTQSAFGSSCIASFTLSGSGSYNISSSGTGTTANIQQFSNGWYRCSLTSQATATAITGVQFRLSDSPTNGAKNYTGDDTSGIYIWGAQSEEGSFPTSYTPTEDSTVTRTPDVVEITGTNFSSWYNQSEGTAFVQYGKIWNGNWDYYRSIARVVDSSFPSRDFFSYGSTNGNNGYQIYWVSKVNNIQQLVYGSYSAGFPVVPAESWKHAIAVQVNDASFVEGGFVRKTDSPSSLPTVDTLELEPTNFHIRRFTYWPARLPDSTLQTITS